MTDIVERLRHYAKFDPDMYDLYPEAADEIERLRAEREKLLSTLKKIEAALRTDSRQKSIVGDEVEYHLDGGAMYSAINAARTAIAKAEREKGG